MIEKMETSEKPGSAREYIEQLHEQNLVFYNDERGRGAIKNLQQTFPYSWIYIAELIQNALDEKAKKLRFVAIDDETLLFEHDGNPFSQKDVKGLCTRGISEKSAKTIGFMGVGFKSVFKCFQKAAVSSGPWKFCLKVPVETGKFGDRQREWLGCVLPEFDEDIDDPSEGMSCRFHLSGRLDELDDIESDLRKVFQDDMSLLPLLALHGVNELVWDDRTILLGMKEEVADSGCVRIRIETFEEKDDQDPVETWLFFSREYNPSDRAIKKFLEHRELKPKTREEETELMEEVSRPRRVQIFCRMDEDDIPVLPETGRAYAVLPTRVLLPFRVNLQADWLLDISRGGFMEFENNQWHKEIMDQLPILIRSFLEWLVSGDCPKKHGWWEGYNILPILDPNDQSHQWVNAEELIRKLREELLESRFLPVRHEDGLIFCPPRAAYGLPAQLSEMFDNEEDFVWDLFGEDIISSALLGENAYEALKKIGLLKKLRPAELSERWRSNTVAKWLSNWEGADVRKTKLIQLLSALHDLRGDFFDNWDEANLCCIPTEGWHWDRCSGIMAHRQEIKRLPEDWRIFNKEPEIRNALKSMAGEERELLDTSIYFYTYREVKDKEERDNLLGAKLFLQEIEEIKLEELVGQWWEALEDQVLTSDTIELILNFTTWVRAKQAGRRNLIAKALARNSDGTVGLLPTNETLLADPYVGEYRKTLFPDIPTVMRDYCDRDPYNGSLNDWRTFFESGDESTKGKFEIQLSYETLYKHSDRTRQLLGRNVHLRVSPCSIEWKGIKITSRWFYLIDGDIEFLDQIEGQHDKALSLVSWLEENPQMLTKEYTKRVAYIPYGYGYVEAEETDEEMAWVAKASANEWVLGSDRQFHKPADVLPQADPLRPEFPHASFSADLTEAFEQIGIKFGDNIPDAPALIRLKIEGPTASVERLNELIGDAVAEVKGNPALVADLEDILSNVNLVPLPKDASTPDGLGRIPFNRIVRHTGPGKSRRSDLLHWVMSKDEFSYDERLERLIERIEDIVPGDMPATTTFFHAVSFVEWVWKNGPPADQVRRYLPAAYEYILNDIELEDEYHQHWVTLAAEANVFTSKKEWRPANQVFFDDIRKSFLRKIIANIEIATFGHLGNDPVTVEKVAGLLGLKRLSNRVKIQLVYGKDVGTPSQWLKNMSEMISIVDKYLETDSSEEDEERGSGRTLQVGLRRVDEINRVVFDNGNRVYEKAVNCDFDENGRNIVVQGDVIDFAGQLAEVLVDILGLAQRGDLVAKISPLLFSLGDPNRFPKHLRELKEFCGLSESGQESEGTGETETDEDNIEVDKDGEVDEYEDEHVEQDEDEDEDEDVEQDEDEDEDEDEDIISGPGGERKKKHRRKRAKRTKRRVNRIVTYVFPGGDDKEEGDDYEEGYDHERTTEIGKAAEDHVMKVEKESGRKPEIMPLNHPGYDIESYGSEEEDARYIEVKGIDGEWTDVGVGMTARQYREAQKKGDSYWLYVVEHARSENPTVHRFQNPVSNIGDYRFDPNWRKLTNSGENGKIRDVIDPS